MRLVAWWVVGVGLLDGGWEENRRNADLVATSKERWHISTPKPCRKPVKENGDHRMTCSNRAVGEGRFGRICEGMRIGVR